MHADAPASGTAARRTVLAGAGLAVGASLAVGTAGGAEATTSRTYRTVRHRGAPLLGTQARHLVGRFSYGVTPALAREVQRQGGARRWFEWQLDPDRISDRAASDLLGWYPGLSWTPGKLWQETTHGGMPGWQVMQDYCCWVLLRRVLSRRQLLETMTEFWENHFNVPVGADGVYTWRKRFADVLRANALGSFEDLLWKVTTHPAMGIYLDNAVSDKDHPNENLGRELLELHTVGVGNYTETDVKSSARILTGWKVDEWNTWAASYDRSAHWVGKVQVGTFRSANASSDGRGVTRDYLRYLAHHPDTAQQLATKLATVFIHDDPPKALVDHLARIYLRHGTQVKPVLRAIVGTPAFRDAVDAKVRDPEGDLVSTYRALGVKVSRPSGESSAPHQIIWQASSIGAMPASWPRPDGQPIDNASWASPSRLLGSMQVHYNMSGGWWPTKNIHYRSPAEWLPTPSIRFDHLVDHLSQQLLHRHASATLLKACSEAVATAPHTTITKDHSVVRWQFPRLLTTFLDSPQFFRR
jgi:hypothetical protein